MRSGPLAPGERVAGFVIVRLLKSSAAGCTYLARPLTNDEGVSEDTGGDAKEVPETVFQLIERPAGGHEDLRPLVRLGLHHPRLLAPRAIVSQDGCDYLVVEAVGEVDAGTDTRPPLDAVAALTAGVGLSDALTYLHRTGVVHLHVSPSAVVVAGGRVRLGGMEDAQLIHPLDPQAPPLFARDANFLARTLGVLAGVVEDVPEHADSTTAALADIVARGAASEFASPEEVGRACSAALPRPEPSLPAAQSLPARARASYVVASATSVGMLRTENQDAAAWAVFDVRDDVSTGDAATVPAAAFLVADGMGGEERGELASRIAARTVLAETVQELLLPVLVTPVEAAQAGLSGADAVLPSLAEALVRAGRSANGRIRKLSTTLGKATGTTLTAFVAVGARAALVHVGDSRAYLLRAGQLTQLTEDHTLLARMQAMDHPLLHDPAFSMPRNYLYRSLGQEDEPDLDVTELTLAPGDRLLLCSDGLWDEVAPDTLHSLLASAQTPRECAEALVAAADAAGGHDNSTAVVVFVGDSLPVHG